jgi:hypothetical protein
LETICRRGSESIRSRSCNAGRSYRILPGLGETQRKLPLRQVDANPGHWQPRLAVKNLTLDAHGRGRGHTISYAGAAARDGRRRTNMKGPNCQEQESVHRTTSSHDCRQLDPGDQEVCIAISDACGPTFPNSLAHRKVETCGSGLRSRVGKG